MDIRRTEGRQPTVSTPEGNNAGSRRLGGGPASTYKEAQVNTYRHRGSTHVRGPHHVYVPDTQREHDRVAERANVAAIVFALAFLLAALTTALWIVPGG